MSNYRFAIAIRPEDVYDILVPEQKEQFDHIEITGAILEPDGVVHIDCLALEDETIETDFRQLPTFNIDGYITAKDEYDTLESERRQFKTITVKVPNVKKYKKLIKEIENDYLYKKLIESIKETNTKQKIH